jgi:N utilization substance protein A
MATKKKTKKKSIQPKKNKKAAPKKAKKVLKSKPAKKPMSAKKAAKSKPVLGKARAKKKTAPPKKAPAATKTVRTSGEGSSAAAFLPESRRSRSGEQSGDLQGLSDREGADSESVDELLDEGNAFEADAVSGVEDADNSDEKEVHTHEVPEDDVPEEYLDKDND